MVGLPGEASGLPGPDPPKPRDFKSRARKSRHNARRSNRIAKPRPGSLLCHTPNGKDPAEECLESPTDGVPAKRFVHRRHVSISPARKRNKSRGSSPCSSHVSPAGHAPSPASLEPAAQEAVQRRVERVGRARLYLLQQRPTSHTFLVGGDSPQHKYRVTIGSQSCSCDRPAPCIHVLFVMVRVLRVPENDHRLFCCSLTNDQVESMVESFKRRRLSCLPGVMLTDTMTSPANLTGTQMVADNCSEDGCCPICLLELVEGESVVRCAAGCPSGLHHHCLSIWAAECRQQQQGVICPLCRAAWPTPPLPAPPDVTLTSASPRLKRRAISAVSSPAGGPAPPRRAAASTPSPARAERAAGRRGSITPSTPGAEAVRSPRLPRRDTAGDAASREQEEPGAGRRGSVSSCDAEPGGGGGRRGSLASDGGLPLPSPQLARRSGGRGSLRRAALRLERPDAADRRHTWAHVLGRELVQLVLSGDWRSRDAGMLRLSEELTGAGGEAGRPGGRSAEELLVSLADLLAALCADPVHKVFVGAIRCLQLLLRQVRPCSTDEAARLRAALSPLVDALLLRSADASRRSAQLSVWTLSQLARGAAGQLLAAELDGLQLVLDCLLQECRSGADSWRWCRGRLTVADHLVTQLPEQFRASPLGGAAGGRVVRMAEFAQRALTHPHTTVSQLARRVFVQMVLAAEADPDAHAQCAGLMAALDSALQQRLKRRMRAAWQTARGGGGGGAAAGIATSAAAGGDPPTPAGRRPRPTFLPLDSASVAAGFRRKQSQRRRQAAAERAAPLHVGECVPPLSTTSTPSAMEVDWVWESASLQQMSCPASSVEEIIVYPHSQDMEGSTPATYTESLDWGRGPLLGTGAYSSCYQAFDLSSGRLMAVKQVHLSTGCGADSPAERQQREAALRDEVALLASLRHQHVLHLLGATRRPTLLNLFTEWEAGGSVAGLLQRYGPLSSAVTRRYTAHLVRGLAYLHDRHVLHRDLKGANLLVDSTGQHLKIGDFGTAAVLGADATLKGEFTGQVLGTVAFMAPEVLRGQHYGRSCDIWSVGCCVIEMATGRPPWDAHTCSNHFALLFRIAGSPTPPPVPSHLADDLKPLASDCLRMDGDKRPAAKHLLHYPCFKEIA